jgi:hypothetical protein
LFYFFLFYFFLALGISLKKVHIACSYAGYRESVKNPNPEVQRNKVSSKTNCKFRINLRTNKAIFPRCRITQILPDHNHVLMSPSENMFDPLMDEMKDLIKQAVANGNRLPFIRSLLAFHHQKSDLDALEVKRYMEKCQRDKLLEFGPIRENELKSMLECVQIANNHVISLSPWFLRYATNAKGNVRAVLWMSPDQATLYHRYRDIVVHDTTQSTNKFNMAMHNFVVVDSAFRTRIVASALTSGEKIQDCRWVLQ